MKTRILTVFMTLALLFCMIPTATAADFDAGVGKDEIPYGEKNANVQAYDFVAFDMLTTAEAASAGVPAGYTGDYVLALTGAYNAGAGIMLDNPVPFNSVASVTFRVWCPDEVKEFRITDCKGADWIARIEPEERNAWIEITFSPASGNFYNSHSFDDFCDFDGSFKPVNVGLRFFDYSPETTVYIDSITFETYAPDTVPPVIRYDGKTEITTSAGKPFVLDASAFDEYEQRNVTLSYLWSAGALDAAGNLLEGDHTCTVTASDYSGNRSTLTLNVHVLPADQNAPEICFEPDVIYVPAGTFNMLDVEVTDDYDDVSAVFSWSTGTFDARGRFAVGEHTMTITATDLSGNEATKVVRVVVSDPFEVVGTLTCDTE